MDSDEMLPLPIPKKKSWTNSSNTNDKHSTDKHRKRSPSDLKKKDRDYRDLLGSTRELARLLAYEDSRELQRSLVDVTGQLKAETLRANEAERKLKETTVRFKTVNDARVAAQQEVARLSEELKLYKRQLDTAQNEIFRAQEILSTVDAQRLEAEQDAAKARNTARRLREEALIERAREDGRRLGLAEGMARGKDIGYHQGRTSGYEHGRSSAERAIEGYYEPVPMVQEFRRISSNDSSSLSLDEYGPPPPPRPDTTTPVPIPIPPPTRRVLPSGDIHPIPVHNSAASPLHPAVDIPPDGWIPEADGDSVIRLPPPHEMARPPPSPGSSRSSSPPLPPVPSDEEPIRMVPGPRYGFGETSQRPGLHRRSSSYSSQGSTTISQLELVGPPSEARRRSGLSVIQEVASILTDGSPNPGQSSGHMPSIYETTPHSPPRMTIPTPMIAVTGVSGLEEQVRGDVYQRPYSSSGSSDEAVVREISRKKSRRMSPASLYSVPEINIQPPTRPPSNISQQQQQPAAARSTSDFLSPADADRPMTLPEAPNTPSTLVFPGGGAPASLPDGRLPAGFVPTTAYTASGVSLPPSALSSVGPFSTDDSFFGGPAHSMPGGFASNPSLSNGAQRHTNGPLEPIYFPSDASPHDPSDAVVIPPPSLRSHLSPGMAGIRRSGSTDSDDDTSSMTSSINTLTTPPPRARRATPAAAYASAPTPPGVSYPLPTPGPSYAHTPSASSRVTHGSAAAGVPLPPSTVGGTPRPTGSTRGDSALKGQASKSSLRSQRSHKRFNRDSYVDPAFLASSENVHETK